MNTKKRGRPPKVKPEVLCKSAGESDFEREKREEERSEDKQYAIDKADEFIKKAEENPIEYPNIVEAKIYRLCPNPRFVMGIPCKDGKPDLSLPLIQIECPSKVRDKILGKTIKAANISIGSQNHYQYIK